MPRLFSPGAWTVRRLRPCFPTELEALALAAALWALAFVAYLLRFAGVLVAPSLRR